MIQFMQFSHLQRNDKFTGINQALEKQCRRKQFSSLSSNMQKEEKRSLNWLECLCINTLTKRTGLRKKHLLWTQKDWKCNIHWKWRRDKTDIPKFILAELDFWSKKAKHYIHNINCQLNIYIIAFFSNSVFKNYSKNREKKSFHIKHTINFLGISAAVRSFYVKLTINVLGIGAAAVQLQKAVRSHLHNLKWNPLIAQPKSLSSKFKFI